MIGKRCVGAGAAYKTLAPLLFLELCGFIGCAGNTRQVSGVAVLLSACRSRAAGSPMPFGLNTLPFGLNELPFGLNVLLFGLNLLPFGLNVLPFGLNVLPFGLNVLPFGLNVLPFGLNVLPFGLKMLALGGAGIKDAGAEGAATRALPPVSERIASATESAMRS